MSGKIDDLIPTAQEIQAQASIKEAEMAEERLRHIAAAEDAQRLDRKAEQTFRPLWGGEDQAGFDCYPAAARETIAQAVPPRPAFHPE